MKIEKNSKKDDWLVKQSNGEKIVIKPTANALHYITPSYLMIHYTATDTASNAIDWFMNTPPTNPNKIAAHIVVDLDGTITQLVPFNRRANHAGYSNWDGKPSLNLHSIGIEIVNPGFVLKNQDGTFKRWIDKKKNKFVTYPASASSKIIQAKHKHKFWTDPENNFWFKFPQAQMNAVYELSKVLINHYQLVTAIGHDDASPARKPDPGPAFPWSEFKTKVFGSVNQIGNVMVVNSTDGFANLRTEPDKNATLIKKLTNGYEVGVIETFGQWTKVFLVDKRSEVVAPDDSSIKTIGWVFGSLLKLK